MSREKKLDQYQKVKPLERQEKQYNGNSNISHKNGVNKTRNKYSLSETPVTKLQKWIQQEAITEMDPDHFSKQQFKYDKYYDKYNE